MIYYQEGFCGGYRQSMPVYMRKAVMETITKSKCIVKIGKGAKKVHANASKMHQKLCRFI